MAEKSQRALKEEKILSFWKENKIFEKSLEKKSPKGEFVFYEGPPTANGRPGIHHIEARAFKDAIPRYKTMQGYHVGRKGGWDTHGLPVELEVEKQLGLKSKKEIEQYGIAKFNEECKKSVWKYVDEWYQFTDRMGYWVDMANAYVTYHNSYIESVWSILAHVEKKNLLYKDYKVLPWCPRCGTALSSHELAQGYQDVKDISLYVKFKIKDFPNAYFLAWTTTPWTLPGNVALAVGKDIEYVKYNWAGKFFIVARDRAHKWPGHEVEKFLGKDLVGIEYEPLYEFSPKNENSHKVYEADFVTTTDGTGIVHTAVMYGQDDFVLGNKVGLPKHHLVDETGHFKAETGFLAGKSVVEETTAVEILKDLQSRELLFEKESHTHSYPFCWRCKTRLIYYARDSWYIAMSKLRNELVKENEKINWVPEYIREGRFGDWLNEVKDWAISRERYWGTPLPVWENADKSKRIVVDSLETLKKYSKKSGNKYFVMRHGESENIVKGVQDLTGDPTNHLTEKGREEVKNKVRDLKKVELIITSPFLRTRETAEIVQVELGLLEEALVVDERIHETRPNEDGMSMRRRMGEFIFDIEKRYQNKNILIVSHGMPLWVLERVVVGQQSNDFTENSQHNTAETQELPFVPFPHNDNFELDLHRPYIDEVVLEKDGEEYRRVKEVMDVWFDSGAMPFAQDPDNVRFPADFISEAIDQTRGWFYTLHAIGILMEKGRAYKNVICLGHILDKEGKKMSKSVGNVVNPWEMIDKYGVDTLRLWMYSVNQPGESKNFDERSVDEVQKKVINRLENVISFWELYSPNAPQEYPNGKIHLLDHWLDVRLSRLVKDVTAGLENYELDKASRPIADFVDDLSTWYLRRSRTRPEALPTLRYTLQALAVTIAPFMPFLAEDIHQRLKGWRNEKESVHLENWIDKMTPDADDHAGTLEDMESARKIVSLALELRQKANIKVRQPLQKLTVKSLQLEASYIEIIKEEINVKEIVEDKNLETEMQLDTNITPELEVEGRVRDAIRAIQEWRKEQGLKPGQIAKYEMVDELLFTHKVEIEKATNVELSHLHN